MSDRGPFDGRAIIAALLEGEVDFIVIGGLAVVAHGHLRTTDDVDIVPAPDRENLSRLATVLDELDYEIWGTEEFDPSELVRPDLEGLLAGWSWVLVTKHGGLDVMQVVQPDDLDYAALAAEAIVTHVIGHEVRVCGYRHLLAMKQAAGRPQDLADLHALRETRDRP